MGFDMANFRSKIEVFYCKRKSAQKYFMGVSFLLFPQVDPSSISFIKFRDTNKVKNGLNTDSYRFYSFKN